MNHFTDDGGFKAIGSQPVWAFKATRPPGDHPVGAYFTTLGPEAPNLAARLRISRAKVAYVFQFVDHGDLKALRGDRGDFIFYSSTDYLVTEARQAYKGASGL